MKIFDGRRHAVVLALAVFMMTATACDFMRVLAGRPTGKDIENKRVEIMKAEEAALQARLDSIRQAEQKMAADSVAAVEYLTSCGVVMSGPERFGGLASQGLPARYYVIAGAFKDRGNARKLADAAASKGYDASLIDCRRGMVAVGLCPSDNIAQIGSVYEALKGETFCPADAWVLVIE